jgi:hypothetical protein
MLWRAKDVVDENRTERCSVQAVPNLTLAAE